MDINETAVEVVSFRDPAKKKSDAVNTKHPDKRAFMSSKIVRKKPQQEKKAVENEEKTDDEDNELDNQLNKMAAHVISQFNHEQLTGRDRLKSISAQLDALGAKPMKRPKTSLAIFEGMKKCAKKRVEGKIEEAKNLGVYTKSLEKEFFSSEQSLKSIGKTVKKKKMQKGFDAISCKVKDGTVSVSKQTIDRISKLGQKARKTKTPRSSASHKKGRKKK